MVIQGIFRGKKERWQGYPADMIRATPAPSAEHANDVFSTVHRGGEGVPIGMKRATSAPSVDLHTKDISPALWGGDHAQRNGEGQVFIYTVSI